MVRRPHGVGRRKIEIKRIENKHNLKTAFTKRRKGLFKKAEEFCTVCDGANAAVITFSPYGRAYAFGKPNPETVVARFLNMNSCSSVGSDTEIEISEDDCNCNWWEESIEDMKTDELEKFRDCLMELKKNVLDRIEDLEMRRAATIDFWQQEQSVC